MSRRSIVYDSVTNDSFELQKDNVSKHLFRPSTKGLLYLSVYNDVALVTRVED